MEWAPAWARGRAAGAFLGLCVAGVGGCGPARLQAEPAAAPAANFRGTEYQRPAALAARSPQAPPTATEPGDEGAPPADLRPRTGSHDSVLAEQVRNAANRDRETERLIRRYVSFVRAMVDGSAPRALPGSIDTYDPVVPLRMHAGLLRELDTLLRTAGALQQRCDELAILHHIDLQGPIDVRGRAGRVRLLARVFGCIRRDAEARVAQGQLYVDAQRSGRSDDDLRAERMGGRHAADDLAMLARTVDCSRLALKTFPRD